MSPGARVALSGATALAIASFAVAAWQIPDEPDSPQSLANLYFAATPDYDTALAKYKRVWPPAYPTVLWVGARAGLDIEHINLVLFLATLALLVPLARWAAPETHPVFAVIAYAVCGFNYTNLRQLASEALLIPLALVAALVAARCLRGAAARDPWVLAALVAAACLTRYFAIFWLVPVVAAAVALAKLHPLRERLSRAAALAVLALLPVSVWMWKVWLETGHLTGAPRFEPRLFLAQTTLGGNLLYTLRTLFLDLCTPEIATHAAVGRDWLLTPGGAALAAALAALTGACAVAAYRAAARSTESANSAATAPGTAAVILRYFSLGYFGWIILLWTAGNNDPIYSRFLYPSYVFLGLSAFHIHSKVKARTETDARLLRAPFHALYLAFVGIQGWGTVRPVLGLLF